MPCFRLQVTKIQTGYDRWERLPAGSESRATVAHDLVGCCCLGAARPCFVLTALVFGRDAQVNECDSVLWQARVLAPVLLLSLFVLNVNVQLQLEELDRATEMAEKDFARFRIERSELSSRRSWNTNTRAQVRGENRAPRQGEGRTDAARTHR